MREKGVPCELQSLPGLLSVLYDIFRLLCRTLLLVVVFWFYIGCEKQQDSSSLYSAGWEPLPAQILLGVKCFQVQGLCQQQGESGCVWTGFVCTSTGRGDAQSSARAVAVVQG